MIKRMVPRKKENKIKTRENVETLKLNNYFSWIEIKIRTNPCDYIIKGIGYWILFSIMFIPCIGYTKSIVIYTLIMHRY